MSELAVRFHHLRAIGRAPALGRFAMQGGTVEEEDENDDDEKKSREVELGAATHNIITGARRVVAAPMARNERHKAYQDFLAANPGAQVVTESMYEQANRIADAVRGHRDVAPLLDGATFEETLYFDFLGEKCRSTPDVRRNHVAELKSTKSAHPREFLRDAERRFYDAQVAMERLAVIEACGFTPDDCFIIAYEKTPPFLVTVLRLTEARLRAGEDQLAEWMERLIECRRSGHWPGYAEGPLDWDIPEQTTTLGRALRAG